MIINYPDHKTKEENSQKIILRQKSDVAPTKGVKVGVLGAGLYANAVFLPILKKSENVEKVGICSAKGLNARQSAKKFDFHFATTDENEIIRNSDLNTVVILTRHNDHARQVIESLNFNKHVYCEKPLALSIDELNLITTAFNDSESSLMVGFNRRFAPLLQKLKQTLDQSGEPKRIHYRINAGYLPLDHWLHNQNLGGGRVIGEGCHFIDLCIYLASSKPISVQTIGLPNIGKYKNDNVTIQIIFEDGSIATVDYLANGDKSVEKEYLETFSGGTVGQLHDFRNLIITSNDTKKSFSNGMKQDKGHLGAWQAFLNSIETGSEPPIPFEELFTTSVTTIAANESLNKNQVINL